MRVFMRFMFFVVIGLVITGSTIAYGKSFVTLGNVNSERTWVYLCGLTNDFNSVDEQANRQIIDKISRDLGIRVLAIKPKHRCAKYNNMLCWPHNTRKQVFNTYNYIKNTTKRIPILGWIGFSNGGFFLNKLVQYQKLNAPIVSIGSGGYLGGEAVPNKVYLLIGKQDEYHYENAKNLYKQSLKSEVHIELIEYSGGHVIAKEPLERLLHCLSGSSANKE